MHKANSKLDNEKRFDDNEYVINDKDSLPPLSEHHMDVLTKKATTIMAANEEITTQMPIIEKSSDDERYLYIYSNMKHWFRSIIIIAWYYIICVCVYVIYTHTIHKYKLISCDCDHAHKNSLFTH